MKKPYKSPCVAVLGSVADSTAAEFPDGVGIQCITDRKNCTVMLLTRLPGREAAVAYMSSLEAIDEVIADLQAARADLVKLLRKKGA